MNQLFTVQEAVDYLKMSRGWIEAAVRDGRLKRVKFGRAVRFRLSDLDEFAARNIEGSVPALGCALSPTAYSQVIEKTIGAKR